MDERESLAAKPPHRKKAIERKVTTKAAILAGFPLLRSPSFQLFTAPEKGTLKSSQASFQGPPNDELDVIAAGRHFQFGFYCSLVTPLALPSVFRYLTPAVAKTFVITLRSHNGDRPSKFIVVAANRKQAINVAWEHGGADFQSRFDEHRTGPGNERRSIYRLAGQHIKLEQPWKFVVI